MKFKKRITQHFNMQPEPFEGKSFQRFVGAVHEAIEDDLFMALIGGPGCGKKTVVAAVVREVLEQNKMNGRKQHLIYVKVNTDAKITIGHIVNEMIITLSDGGEKPASDFYSRKRQLTALLGRTTYEGIHKVTLIIEQAQHLHGNTIRALKELRELNFLDKIELFGIILTGHYSLRGKINNLDDVAKRVELELMDEASGWMNESERLEYLKVRWGNILTPKMRKQIIKNNKTPLAMDVIVYSKMKVVYRRGENEFTERDFLPLRVLLEKHPISYQKIADATKSNLSKTTVARIANGDTGDFDADTIAEVENTVNRLIPGDEISKAS